MRPPLTVIFESAHEYIRDPAENARINKLTDDVRVVVENLFSGATVT